METNELINELENRGHSVTRCEHKPGKVKVVPDWTPALCGEPAVGTISGLNVCEECRQMIYMADRKAKYGCVAACIPASEMIMAEVHRLAMDGKAPEVIAKWLYGQTGHTMEEWAKVEEYVHAGRKLNVWLVWGTVDGRLWDSKDQKMLILARSGAEARKVWREYLYKRGTKNIPNTCEAVHATHGDNLKPMVISTSPEWDIEYKLGIHGE